MFSATVGMRWASAEVLTISLAAPPRTAICAEASSSESAGSGESGRNHWPNLDRLKPTDEIKFVLKDRADYDYARDVVARRGRSLVVDAMSSFGAIPIDARKIPFDALIAASGKCIEGPPGTVHGLGLLAVDTVLAGDKRLAPASGTTADGTPFRGYEMHMGVTEGPDRARPFARVGDAPEGAMSADGRVIGTYIHGLFADDGQRSAWLARFGAGHAAIAHDDLIESTLDGLAAHVARHIDLDRLLSLSR